MLEQQVGKVFQYKKLTEEEQKARGILGRLVGVIADTERPTRNERRYSKKLWDNVFSDPIMIEKIKNKCCFGELNHPADVAEVDIKQVAVSLAEVPKRGEDGRLYGVFDILSTPNGKILKTLCDYGSKLGISSRGSGDIIEDEQGNEEVDPDTYNCECFDIVIVPGVEAARPQYTTECLHSRCTDDKLKIALKESLSEVSDNDRIIMENTLKNRLNITLTESDNEEVTAVNNSVHPAISGEMQNKLHGQNYLNQANIATEEKEAKIVDTDKLKTIAEDTDIENIDDEPTEVEQEKSDAAEDADESEIDTSLENSEDSEEPVSDDEDNEFEFNFDDLVDMEEQPKEESDEDIFLRFLTTNYTEKQIDKVCKVLEIDPEDLELVDDDNKKESEAEESNDDEVNDKSESEDDETTTDEDSESEEKEEEDEKTDNEDEAGDDGSEELVSSLKETLKRKSDLENIVKTLQEKLAVSDAKVDNACRDRDRYKSAVTRLSMIAKSTKDLRESVSTLETSASNQSKLIEIQKKRIKALAAARNEELANSKKLTALKESVLKDTSKQKIRITQLQEEVETAKASKEKAITELQAKLTESNNSKIAYKNLANKVVNKYIEVKADYLGLTSTDIKHRLGESYSLEDVDKVCENLRSYQMNIRKLPFNVNAPMSIKISESVPRNHSVAYDDDSVDDGLLKLASGNL